MTQMDSIVNQMENFTLVENNHQYHIQQMINYINLLDIHNSIKQRLIFLVENDNIESYVDIYNICIENDIELPPI